MDLPQIYSEVYAVLEALGREYINKIPKKIYQYISSQKDNNNIKYDINKPISEQEISKEALIFISYLNLEYWCNTDEKQELLKIYKQNDENIEEQLREKYDIDRIFKNRQNYQQNQETEKMQLIEYNKKNYIKIIIDKVINIICFWRKK